MTDRKLLAVLINTQGKEVTKNFLIQAGNTPEAADKEIVACQKAVAEDALKSAYKAFNADIGVQAAGFMQAYVDAGNLPETVDQVEITLCYTPHELKIKDDQIVQPGGYLTKIRVKLVDADDDTWKTISSIGRQSRAAGGGGGKNVLCPKDAPFKSWRIHAEAAYTVVDSKPDYEAGELKIGTGYSAPDQLTKVGDCVYLYCNKIKTEEEKQATWDEVLNNCPDANSVVYPTA